MGEESYEFTRKLERLLGHTHDELMEMGRNPTQGRGKIEMKTISLRRSINQEEIIPIAKINYNAHTDETKIEEYPIEDQ
jgi:hypothetical protein